MGAQRPRLAIYGGAFNPPTLGHVSAVTRLVSAGFDRVLVMPCYGHTFGKSMAPATDRLMMASEAFRDIPQVRVSSFEIDLGMSGSTFELVQKLPQFAEFQTHQMYMAIGSDEANLFHRWSRHDELRAMIPFVVIPRAGHQINDDGKWAFANPHVVIPDDPIAKEISSSRARKALIDGDEVWSALISAGVLRLIVTRCIYDSRILPAQALIGGIC